MTARKRPAKKPPAQKPPAEETEQFRDEVSEDIEDFFEHAGESSVVYVYRIGKAGERDVYEDVLTLAQMTNPSPQQALRDNFGGGNFKCVLRSPNERGRLVYAGSTRYTIGGEPKVRTAGNGNGAAHAGMSPIEVLMREDSRRNHEMLITLLAANKPQQLDLQGLAALLGVLTGGNKQNDLATIVTAFTQLKSAAEPKDTVETIKSAVELARSLSPATAPAGGDGDSDLSWGSVIKGALGAFSGFARPQLPPPGGPVLSPGNDEEPEGENDNDMWQKILSDQLQFLKTKAKAGKPVEYWIRYTQENPDEIGVKAISMALSQGATFENLLTFDNEIAAHPQLRLWFKAFYDGLKRPPDTAPPVNGKGWDPRDPTNHAPSRVEGQSDNPGSHGSGGAG